MIIQMYLLYFVHIFSEFPPAVDGILMDVQYTNNSSRAMCYNSTRIRIGKAGLEVIWDRRFMNLRIGGSNGRHLEDVIQQSTHQRYLRTINCLSDSLFSDVHLSGFEVKGLCSVLFENGTQSSFLVVFYIINWTGL